MDDIMWVFMLKEINALKKIGKLIWIISRYYSDSYSGDTLNVYLDNIRSNDHMYNELNIFKVMCSMPTKGVLKLSSGV